MRRGTLTAERQATIRQAAESLIEGMKDGMVRNRSGDVYKPSVVRGYQAHLNRHVLPALGGMKLDAVRRADVQALCNHLVAEGASPSTVRNAIMPLRVLYRRALRVGQVTVSPLEHLELPAVRGVRDRVASPGEAAALLAALPPGDRAVWATALYAGLRLGELKALQVADVDLDEGRISVERSWDVEAGVIAPKSRSGRRRVPIAEELRGHLAEHLLLSGRRAGLIFGRSETVPFAHVSLRERALRVWGAAGLKPIGLHECRHTFASMCIAAGVNARGLMAYLGHSSIQMTFDRYGHLMPGNESEAAELLNAYLRRSSRPGAWDES